MDLELDDLRDFIEKEKAELFGLTSNNTKPPRTFIDHTSTDNHASNSHNNEMLSILPEESTSNHPPMNQKQESLSSFSNFDFDYFQLISSYEPPKIAKAPINNEKGDGKNVEMELEKLVEEVKDWQNEIMLMDVEIEILKNESSFNDFLLLKDLETTTTKDE